MQIEGACKLLLVLCSHVFFFAPILTQLPAGICSIVLRVVRVVADPVSGMFSWTLPKLLFYPTRAHLEKGSVGFSRKSFQDGVVPPVLRMHGTVTAFKHRRGYGFVLGEGIVGGPVSASGIGATDRAQTSATPAAAPDAPPFIFNRAALMGGFYITEGERIAFDVEQRPIGLQSLGASTDSFRVVDENLRDGTEAGLVAKGDEETGKMSVAARIRMYDAKTQTERPIEPVTIRGRVVGWDAVTGTGTIGELDTKGEYHDDAPKFSVALDDFDLSPGTELRAGRYVRFCLEEDDAESDVRSARRVIIDRSMEQRHGVHGRPIIPSNTPRGQSSSTRFAGTITQLNERFGFVLDDYSNGSIFMHNSSVSEKGLQEGERVTYLLREVNMGKHAGKRACFDVRREGTEKTRSHAPAVSQCGHSASHSEDEDDFNLLD